MRAILFVHNVILVLALLESSISPITTASAKANSVDVLAEAPTSLSNVAVTLRAANSETILFQAESEDEVTAPDTSARSIPHLVLNRNGVLTPGFERTLLLTLEDIVVPQSGLYAHIVIESQHSEPDAGRRNAGRIEIWNESRFIPYLSGMEQPSSVDFNLVFQEFVRLGQRVIRTPTDYFSYRVTLTDARGTILQEIGEEFAFLMENQWRVPLPKVLEDAPGAAPSELLIYYYDMIPFQTDVRNPFTQLPRHQVEKYIQAELIPAMVRAFETQSNLWEFPWYEEWSNYRKDEEPKTLSVALGEYGVWFHGAAPSLGHAMISIRVDGTFAGYTKLTDGILSVFQHELFHNQQRNISLHFGSKGNLFGKQGAWKMFSEGTAVLASLVGQPNIQFEPNAGIRSYLKRANNFLGSEEIIGGSLEKSYKEVPYQTVIYWRFLYENCGGLENDVENPAEGMKVIRRALETLYGGKIVDINTSTAVAESLPQIMDVAIRSTPSCKFRSYKESLVHFARAIYLLRVEDGRCPAIRNFSDCGFYDPHQLYNVPRAEAYAISMEQVTLIHGSIPSSYGIDLVELNLDPSADGKSLQVIFKNPSYSEHEFNVEVWKLRAAGVDLESKRHLSKIGEPKSIQSQNGFLLLEIDNVDTADFNGLGLIITRMDPYEDRETAARYSIELIVE